MQDLLNRSTLALSYQSGGGSPKAVRRRRLNFKKRFDKVRILLKRFRSELITGTKEAEPTRSELS